MPARINTVIPANAEIQFTPFAYLENSQMHKLGPGVRRDDGTVSRPSRFIHPC